MIYRYPGYCDDFRCIAGKCTDNCCIGWEIDIDEDTLAYYSSISGSFGQRLKDSISGGCFTLTEHERCPFLNSEDLCDIFTELGEEHLCQICSDHPRYFEWFGDVKEGGIGMSCEEAARLILTSDFSISEKEIPDEEASACDEELYSLLSDARDIIICHLMNDPLPEAIAYMLDLCEELQSNIDNGNYSLPGEISVSSPERPDITSVLRYYRRLEPIDDNWIPYIDNCISSADDIHINFSRYEKYLRRIAVYFIFRYFMKGTFDGEIMSRAKLSAVSAWTVAFFWQQNGSSSLDELIQAAKYYSKEVEYCEENLDTLADAFYDEEFFSSPCIKGLFDTNVNDNAV